MAAEYLSPVVIHQQAESFADAGRREFQQGDGGFVAYFLVARAIELALKSSLLLRGYTVPELKKLSHDLVTILEEAATGDEPYELVKLLPRQETTMASINEYYHRKDLEYLTTGLKSLPHPEPLLECVDAILGQVERRLRGWRPPLGG